MDGARRYEVLLGHFTNRTQAEAVLRQLSAFPEATVAAAMPATPTPGVAAAVPAAATPGVVVAAPTITPPAAPAQPAAAVPSGTRDPTVDRRSTGRGPAVGARRSRSSSAEPAHRSAGRSGAAERTRRDRAAERVAQPAAQPLHTGCTRTGWRGAGERRATRRARASSSKPTSSSTPQAKAATACGANSRPCRHPRRKRRPRRHARKLKPPSPARHRVTYFGGNGQVRSQDFKDSPIAGLPQVAGDPLFSADKAQQLLNDIDLTWRRRDTEQRCAFRLPRFLHRRPGALRQEQEPALGAVCRLQVTDRSLRRSPGSSVANRRWCAGPLRRRVGQHDPAAQAQAERGGRRADRHILRFQAPLLWHVARCRFAAAEFRRRGLRDPADHR